MASQVMLLVEDSPEDAYLVERILRREGLAHRIEHVGDGYQAIFYLMGSGLYADREKFPVPDLILLDLTLPVLGGFDVLAWARAQAAFKDTPIFVLSCSEDPEDADQAYLLGADRFVVKNPGFTQLLLALRAYYQHEEDAGARNLRRLRSLSSKPPPLK